MNTPLMAENSFEAISVLSSPRATEVADTVTVCGEDLTIENVVRVARHGARVCLTEEEHVLRRVIAAYDYITTAVETSQPIYGVTTGFGGMANVVISREDAAELQNNLLWFLKAGAGRRLPKADVRAAMLLRANSHLRGVSGVRLELIRRIVTFLNEGVTPHVLEFGSIGASGDLVPLASITGALIGLDASFTVDFNGEEIDALTALTRLNLPRLRLHPKEGLAMVNGTSVMTGIAANCVYDAQVLLKLALALAMMKVIEEEGLTDADYIHQYTVGYEQFVERLHALSLDDLSRTCDVPLLKIRELAHAYATTKPATIRMGIGIQRCGGAAAAVRAVACLPAQTGAWRAVGGGMCNFWGAMFTAQDTARAMRPDLSPADTREINMVRLAEHLLDPSLSPPITSAVQLQL